MSRHDDYLENEQREYENHIKGVIDRTYDILGNYHEKFFHGTIKNIPQQFGEYLYTCLGDRVTGQRSSVVNQDYIDAHPAIINAAKQNNMTLEEYVIYQKKMSGNRDTFSRRFRGNQWEDFQMYITTGRKFGVSYHTGNDDRVHTVYFGAGKCFQYLTQEHVDCILNKDKKACTQAFLDYRNDFISKFNELNNQMIPIDVEFKSGIVSCITKSLKHNGQPEDKYNILDEVLNNKLTHMCISLNSVPVWNKKTNIPTSSKTDDIQVPSFISISFFKLVGTTFELCGNIDLGMNNFKSGIELANNIKGSHNILHIPENQILDMYRFQREPFKSTFPQYQQYIHSGVMYNFDEVIQHPAITEYLDKCIAFYNTMSDRLQTLKHEWASLYFVNSDI
jgi:hypothetical protein